ncbi:MAG: alkaline phosphatase family protein [Myxococcales bacterium]|nr:alkaline phosphatase family protein [Myxococcales bacterium]
MRTLDLFVFIDAMGWDIVEKNQAFAWLDAYRAPARTILGYSSTCVPSILSGMLPQEHGHWTLFQRAQGTSSLAPLHKLRRLPKSFGEHHRFRRWLSKAYGRYAGIEGYFDLYALDFGKMKDFDYTEKQNIFSVSQTCFPTIFQKLDEKKIPYWCADWKKSEEEGVASLRKRLKEDPTCRWAFLYFPRLDGLMHRHGPQGATLRLYWYEETLRELTRDLKAQGWEVRLTVMSDHGMTPIHRHVEIPTLDGTAGLRWGEDYLALYDATLARYWFLRPQARERIMESLSHVDFGHWLTRAEISREGLCFEDNRYGDAYFLTNPGVLIHPNDMGQNPPLGMHGFDPADVHSTATILSDHPEAHSVLGETPRIDDFYRLMATALPPSVAETKRIYTPSRQELHSQALHLTASSQASVSSRKEASR